MLATYLEFCNDAHCEERKKVIVELKIIRLSMQLSLFKIKRSCLKGINLEMFLSLTTVQKDCLINT